MSDPVEGQAVELTGIARLLDDPRITPLTGEPCVAHVSRARVFTALDHVGDFVDQIDSFEIAPFALDTPGGLVVVLDKPTVVELELEPLGWIDPTRSTRFLAPKNLARYVRSTFFEQAIVRDGERLTVFGVITREVAPALEAGFRELPEHTRLTGYGNYPLTLRR